MTSFRVAEDGCQKFEKLIVGYISSLAEQTALVLLVAPNALALGDALRDGTWVRRLAVLVMPDAICEWGSGVVKGSAQRNLIELYIH
ncbi:hypothetical protein L218DRAFT_1002938 [Marasmius fiardii PR-910]|nr:hypothetical protein L218DRAFT_1002938 [Marasmius fiardii PR-910]